MLLHKSALTLILAAALAWAAPMPALAAGEDNPPPTKIVQITMPDGVKIAAALYLPKAPGKYPTLLAASPYRFDNDQVPALPIFLWRETGPIGWYNEQGYAYVHMDVRGTGRSGGTYGYMDEKEQRDLYDVIEWIAQQPWSSGKVGGIAQSYYARMQWFMGIQNPPHLACIAPYDGNVDTYRSSAFSGGIPGEFPYIWYNSAVRATNKYPAQGPSRVVNYDYPNDVRKHTTYDAYWKSRAAAENLDKIKVPVFSIGVWSKVDLHLNGNIVGFQRAGGPKKMLVFGAANLFAAAADFGTIAFHERWLLPFYDWCLKGKETSYTKEPAVRYYLGNTDQIKTADAWPPKGIQYRPYYLGKGATGSVTSLNDGRLGNSAPAADGGETVFNYPDPGWRAGTVGMGPDGRPDPVRRILTFTTEPLEDDLEVTGPLELVLYASSTNKDTDFIVKVSEQLPQAAEERQKDVQPRSRVVTKGWLRASHREVDSKWSLEHAPWYTHVKPQKLEPGKIYEFRVAVMPTAYLLKKGSRIRVELANGDSVLTEFVFQHEYTPDKVGRDTIHHNATYPSQILIPVMPKQTASADR